MGDEGEGLSIALTPVQMAAVLGDHEVPESASLSNRIWGTVGLVGGVLELVGAGVLCVAPEPTMVSKVGCVVLGVHGSDTVATSARQMWTGVPQRSATAVTASSAAEAMGASRQTADGIGLAVDVAVPLVVATGLVAARVIAVRASRFRLAPVDLARHEAVAGSKAGGHAIREHVGKSSTELLARLAAKPSLQKSSSFTDLATAEAAISATVRANARAIKAWSRSASVGSRPQAFEHTVGSVVGIGVQRGSSTVSQLSSVRMVLNMRSYNGMPYYILTAHPF
ncbi:MAG: hypothetical protein EOP81_12105 [Variovorax sp.]|nr:MAG: hypothetical protein EOP81_12105 [Variovorax sp.]